VREILRLAVLLGSEDIKETYRRTLIGPMWITIGLGIQVATIGLVFSLVFGINLPEYLPFLAISLILWNAIQLTATESTQAFIQSERLMKQIQLPYSALTLRVVWKNALVFGHNFMIIPIVFVLFWSEPRWTIFLAIPGLLLVAVNLSWVALILGFMTARYRDVAQIVQSLITISFYLTPVLWQPSAVPPEFRNVVLNFNPFFHLMEIVRGPLLGQTPAPTSWVVASVMALLGVLIARIVSKKWKSRLAYWV